jgi:hypothetical protein
MNRLGSAFRLMFYLPALWVALGVIALAVAVNGSEPFADIARYAIQRLFLQ